FADGWEVFDWDVANLKVAVGSYDGQLFPCRSTRGGHFPDSSGHAINVVERIGEPGAFAILQGDRNYAGQFLKNRSQPFSRGRLTVKTVDVRRENYEDGHNRAKCLYALDHVAAADLLNELFEKTKDELLSDHVCHEKCAALRFADSVQLRGEPCLYFRPREIT